MSYYPLSGYSPLTLRDLWEILRLPVLFALAAIAGTWVVWYLTSTSCAAELAQTTGCNPSLMASYINLDALNKMMTHAVIAGGGGGLWSYVMTTRQRKAIEHLAKQLAEERDRAAEERERAESRIAEEQERTNEERQRADEERERADEERERFATMLTEERQQAAEERQQAAEERQQAAEDRMRFLALIESMREQRNGNNESSE